MTETRVHITVTVDLPFGISLDKQAQLVIEQINDIAKRFGGGIIQYVAELR